MIQWLVCLGSNLGSDICQGGGWDRYVSNMIFIGYFGVGKQSVTRLEDFERIVDASRLCVTRVSKMPVSGASGAG